MGEKQNEPFQFTFNDFLNVAFQRSRVTSDACLILVLPKRIDTWSLTSLQQRLVKTGIA